MLRSKLFGSKPPPPRAHSVEHLKSLYESLRKVDWSKTKNVETVVESLRSLAEILIWGDQNDPTVFDYFLEKQMLSYFVQIIQKCAPDLQSSSAGNAAHESITIAATNNTADNNQQQAPVVSTSEATTSSGASLTQQAKNHICVQVLQLLCILFENTEHQTSLYYLLSNNHVNNIIESSYDFTNDDVLAQYISMLKALSLKLNAHTIHFFFNEQTQGFAILRHCLNFLSNQESMVRIASRTVCLNVLRVDEERARHFIFEHHADFVFSRIVHEVRQHLLLKLDKMVRQFYGVLQKSSTSSPTRAAFERLRGLHDDYCDNIGFLNEIFYLGVSSFSSGLRLHLLNKLFIPVHLTSLFEYIGTQKVPDDDESLLHPVAALYSLGLCFSSIRDAEFCDDLASFMLSKTSALSVNDQCFFEVLLNILRLPAADECKAISSNEEGADVAVGNNITPIATQAFFVLILPMLCFLASLSQSTVFDSRPKYREIFFDHETMLTTLVQLVAKMCQDSGKGLAVICMHLAATIIETVVALQAASFVQPPVTDAVILHTDNALQPRVDELISVSSDPDPRQPHDSNSNGKPISTVAQPQHYSIVSDHHIACLEDAKEHCLLMLRRFYQPTYGFVLSYLSQYEAVLSFNSKVDNLWLHTLSNGTYQHQQFGRRLVSNNCMVACQDELIFDVMCDASDSETSALRSFVLLSKLCCVVQTEKNPRCSSFDHLQLADERCAADSSGISDEKKLPTDILAKDDLLDVTKCELLSCTFYESWYADGNSPSSASKSSAPSLSVSGSSPLPACSARLRFLVAHPRQLVLVEPSAKAGLAVVREVFPLHLCLVVNDKEERTRSALLLKVFALHPWAASGDYESLISTGGGGSAAVSPAFSPSPDAKISNDRSSQCISSVQIKFVVNGRLKFDDHIRCSAAAHKLKERKSKLLELHLQRLAHILDLPAALRPVSSSTSRASSNSSSCAALPTTGRPPVPTRHPPSAIEAMHQSSMFPDKLWSSPSRRPRPGGLARLLTTTSDSNSKSTSFASTALTVQHSVFNENKHADIPMIYMPPSLSSAATTPVNQDNILIDLTPEKPPSDLNHFSGYDISSAKSPEKSNNNEELSTVFPAHDFRSSSQIIHVPSSESEPVLSIMQRDGSDSAAVAATSSFILLSSSSASSENNIFSSRPSTAGSAAPAALQKLGEASSASASSSTNSSPNRDDGKNDAGSNNARKPLRRTHKPGTVHHI